MKIEIAETGRMTQTGSSLLKLIQNNDMPVLDLLVRESIQNSLDARKEDSRFVEMDYITGSFNNVTLSQELEGITDALRMRFPKEKYKFLAIRDSHTVGLTGELDYKKIKNNDYGNLLKLIYEICKPQEAEGAGGSWGLGKTVYFRIGIGLVIYYSRIKTKDGYASRLAASYVEDETASDSMIPVYQEQAKRGIAWWGREVGENLTQPVTDEKYIAEFLECFGLNPYANEQTGTMIVIPYIDEERLLTNNQKEYENGRGQTVIPYWCKDIESYIKVAVQRWYAPRLNNVYYTHGAFLRLRINGEGVAYDEMEPAFKVIQALYNRANYVHEEDILTNTEAIVKIDGIKVTKYLTDTKVGTVAYAKVPKEVLGMGHPNNKPSPHMYFNCEVGDEEINKPTVCFTRKPAMIVSYENVGAWTSSIASTSKREYIMAIFVLNSWNQMKNSPKERSLEEYIRRSEMADHTSWSDWSEGTYNPRIITKIQNGVNKLISKEFAPVEEKAKPKVNSGLGKMFGEMLLPPDGFGKQPGPGVAPGGGNASKKRGIIFRIEEAKIKYSSCSMMVPVVLETSGKKKISLAGMEMQIDSEAKRMKIGEWEEKLGLSTPFEIKAIRIHIDMLDGQKNKQVVLLGETENETTIEEVYIKRTFSKAGTCCGIKIISDKGHSIKARLNLTVGINRRDVKPAFIFEKETANGK